MGFAAHHPSAFLLIAQILGNRLAPILSPCALAGGPFRTQEKDKLTCTDWYVTLSRL